MQPALQEITNRINQVNNILVTVKANPTVDELAAALGLTMALNNYGKHATAVFSGQIPNAMSFLKPQKTFENNVHSLRDFIISLNKEKADKLRFAKDGEIVKIYITPYKSTITPNDLAYSEGDFNVEMVIAVGINAKEELDTVIAAHGRILHEATVATVMAGPNPSQLGSINWFDPTLSSASAMSLQLLQSLGNPGLLSPEVSTALLTGIVADTDRFSNAKTSPRIMELSAQLMSSGADHQLVTSSIGTGTPQPGAAQKPMGSAVLPTDITPNQAQPDQQIVLELHNPDQTQVNPNTEPSSEVMQSPALSPSSENTNLSTGAALNTSPMLSSPPETTATSLRNPEPTLSKQLPPPPPNPLANIPSQPTVSEPVAQLLPQPVDATQTVVPSDLLPPAPAQTYSPEQTSPNNTAPISPIQTGVAIEPSPVPSNTTTESTVTAEADIRSEIDKIYSSEPFDPANNPRQDLGTNVVLPTEEHVQSIGAPAFSVDTSVQQSQAAEPLKPIEATKDESVNINDVLGSDPAAPATQSAKIPGLEMPPEITLPTPPPPPNPPTKGKTSSIDTEPFGTTVNFDPTKPADNAA